MQPIRWLRGKIYDAAIVPLTAGWYRAVLQRLPHGCRLLDIGIGTGTALVANAALVVEKDLHVVGVDIDASYIERCQAAIRAADLGARVEARLQSIYDHTGGPYGAAYFSASFMLLPDPPAALRHVASQLLPDGKIFFTQTFEHQRSRFVEITKPLLKLVTTIDFGQVTYEDDFRRALDAGGVTILDWQVFEPGRRRSSVLVEARVVRA